MKNIKPEHVYIIVLAFFLASASIRYAGEFVHAQLFASAVAAEIER